MIPKKLVDEINRWIAEGRYGNLQINFAGGKILNVNRVESIKIDMIISNDSHVSSTLSKEVSPK